MVPCPVPGDPAMRRLAALVIALALALAACGGGTAAVTQVEPVEAAELIESTDDLVVLDVRTPEEVAAGAIPGAINIDLSSPDFSARVADLDPTLPYLVYCRSANRSAQAVAVMADLGFTDLYEMAGGIISWANAGGPVVSG